MRSSPWGYITFVILFLVGILLVNGCSEEEPVLARDNKIMADSIIRVEFITIVQEVDSLCRIGYDQVFAQAVDSISLVRLKEIEKYIPTK